jgi:hypothetical protein
MVLAVLVALSLLSLVLQDVLWLRESYISPQDKALIEKITSQLNEDSTWKLLTDFDFEKYSIYTGDLGGLEAIRNEWRGVDYEFSNRNYQKLWEVMKEHITQLLDILHGNADFFNAHNFTISKSGKGEEANKQRDAIFLMYQVFRRIYIRKQPYA